jgi:hypothetical protein
MPSTHDRLLLFPLNTRSLNVARRRTAANNNHTTTHLDFEAELWSAADLLRGNIESAEYKHVVLGLIFLKYAAT